MTLLFLIIIFLFKKYYISILLIFYILAYISQYTGFNYNFFKNNFTVNSSAFAEMLPNAVTGFFIAYIDILNKSNKFKNYSFYMSIIILLLYLNIMNLITVYK